MLCESRQRTLRQVRVDSSLRSIASHSVPARLATFAFLVWLCTVPANADIINFERFNVGDGLAEINAYYEPLGVTFDSFVPSSVEVIADPNDPGGKLLKFDSPGPTFHHLVINFDFTVSQIAADVLNTHPIGSGQPGSLMILFDEEKSAGPAPRFDGFVFSVFGIAPATLSFEWNAIFSGPAQVRAIALEQNDAVALHDTVDNIQFVRAPEVVSPWLGILGVMVLARSFGRRCL